MQALDAASVGIESVEGDTATNDTYLVIPDDMAAPAGYKWVYKLDSSADNIGVFGTQLTGTTDWVSSDTEISASSSTHAHVVLVNATDGKPVKTTTLELVKK